MWYVICTLSVNVVEPRDLSPWQFLERHFVFPPKPPSLATSNTGKCQVSPWVYYVLLWWSPLNPWTGLKTRPEASLLFLSDPSNYLNKDKTRVTILLPGITRDLTPFFLSAEFVLCISSTSFPWLTSIFFSLSHFHLTFLVMCPPKWINEHKVIVVIVGPMSTRWQLN